jgi:hypothetical protein
MKAQPISPEDEAKFRESVRLLGDDGTLQWTNLVAARLLATLDAERERFRVVGTMTEGALTPTGDHHILPEGYCLDCQGGCMVPLAKANTEAIRQAAYAEPDPFSGPTCRCGARTYRPDPDVSTGRRAARRCMGCHRTTGNCNCAAIVAGSPV